MSKYKYIEAEKLKAEITRLKGQLIRGACAAQIEMESNCKDEAYDEVLSILSDLEKEGKPTTADGLEDILLEFYDEYDSNVENRPMIPRIYAEKLVRHFVKWGAEHSGSSEIPEDLEEAAEKYADSMGLRGFDKVRTKSDFKAGVEWKEQQEVDLEEELENPMNQDELEKEYQEFCKDYPFPWSSQYINREYIDELCLSIARHFAKWGAEILKK